MARGDLPRATGIDVEPEKGAGIYMTVVIGAQTAYVARTETVRPVHVIAILLHIVAVIAHQGQPSAKPHESLRVLGNRCSFLTGQVVYMLPVLLCADRLEKAQPKQQDAVCPIDVHAANVGIFRSI